MKREFGSGWELCLLVDFAIYDELCSATIELGDWIVFISEKLWMQPSLYLC